MIAAGPLGAGAIPADVRLVRLDLDAGVPLTDPRFDVLSGEEREAAARFRRPIDALRSAATRAALRRLLGAELGEAPEALRFVRSDRGRPALAAAGEPPLDFNLSHGGDHALIAWSRLRRVGVDIEPLRTGWDWAPLARLVLGPEDARRIAAAPDGPERDGRFLDVWTAKEALLKAEGRGITAGLAEFSVLSEDRLVPRVAGAGEVAARLAGFAALWLRAVPGHAACIAWEAAPA